MTSWKLIKVPEHLHSKLFKIAKEKDKAMWEIIEKALEVYEIYERKDKPKKEIPVIDRISWYVIKLAMSVGAFKENPTIENYQQLEKTARQVKERLGIETGEIIEIAKRYFDEGDETEIKIELNMALKFVVMHMIDKYFFSESQ